MIKVRFFLIGVFLFGGLAHAKEWVYYVTKGDNLWDISKKYLASPSYFKQIQTINQITKPKKMTPGTRIRIPLEWVKVFAASVELSALNGSALRIENNTLIDLVKGEQFTLGDTIQVLDQSTATLTFADGTEMTVIGPATLGFDQLTHYGETGMVDTSVRLQSGLIEVRAKKAKGSGSRLDINTASAITSVRGTVFRTRSITEDDVVHSSIEVLEGKVEVSSGNKSVDVATGFGVVVAGEGNLAEPEVLLPAPEKLSVPREINSSGAQISWSSVFGAESYQVQLSRDTLFSNVVHSATIKQTEYILPKLAEGQYFARVSGVAKSGLIGLNLQSSTIINLTPLPPENVNDVAIYRFSNQQLNWQARNNTKFLLQISKDEQFTSMNIDQTVATNTFNIPDTLEPGQYFWRVATAQSANDLIEQVDIKRGPFSQTAKLDIRMLLIPPNLLVNVQNGQIVVRWTAPNQATLIELQLSDDSDFADSESKTLGGVEHVFSASDAKKQYLRGRFISEVSQNKGEWSGVCSLDNKLQLSVCNIIKMEPTP